MILYSYSLFQILFVFIFTFKINCQPILVVISLDGFRADYVSPGLTPTLYKLAQNGVKGQMLPTFTSITVPNHQSIATGYYQEVHGIINNRMFDPVLNERFSSLRRSDDKWWTDGPQIPVLTINEIAKTNDTRFSGSMQWWGSYAKYRNHSIKYQYNFHPLTFFHKRVNMIIEWMTNPGAKANCIFAYFHEPDFTAHRFGPSSMRVRVQLVRVDNIIKYFLRRLKEVNLLDQTNLIVLSDHGMAEVKRKCKTSLDQILNDKFYEAFGESTILSILAKHDYKEVVYQTLLKESKNRNFTVYKREDIPQRFHYKNNRRILDMIVVADECCDIFIKSNQDDYHRGNHGYDNELPSMQPLFIGSGPAFKKNFTLKNPFINVDLFPLMLNILKVPLEDYPSNGSFSKVSDLLINP